MNILITLRKKASYQNLLATMLIIIALVIINLLAILTADQQTMRRESVITPDLIVMRRESLELDPAFEEALNVSLKRGYCQAVNWEWTEVA